MSKLSVPVVTPFDLATRQTKRSYGSIQLPAQAGVPFPMPKTGFLSKVTALVSGTMTVTLGGGTAVIDPVLGAWGFFSRIILAINGSKQVYNIDGLGCYGFMTLQSSNSQPDYGMIVTPYGHSASVFAAGVGAGANIWKVPFVVQVAPNDDELLGGFINMYDALQATLTLQQPGALYSLTPGIAPVLVTGAATAVFSGVAKISAETFDLPLEQIKATPPGGFLHTINQTQIGLANTGEQQIKLDNEGVYLQILHHMSLNGLGTSVQFDQLALGSQFSYKHYDMESQFVLTQQRLMYGRDLPPGFALIDLFYQGLPNLGGWRDVFDASTVSDFRSFVTITPSATLGTNPTLRTYSRVLEPVPAGAAPQVRG